MPMPASRAVRTTVRKFSSRLRASHSRAESLVRAARLRGRDHLSKNPIEKSCPIVALGPDAASHLASRELNAAYRLGVEALFKIFTEIAETDPSCSLSQKELAFAFAAMVGANMLSRATGDTEWADAVEAMLIERTSQKR